MTDFNYKEYSLEQLENWMHDAMSSDATPNEIYDVIANVVRENYYHHKQQASFAYELMTKFNQRSDKFTGEKLNTVDKVVKWVLPVDVDGLTGECYVNLPDDLLETAKLNEGDTVEWVDNKDGSYTLKKVWEDPYKNEMLTAGYKMIDGVWTLEK